VHDYLNQPDDVFMASVFQLAQVAQGCDLTAEQVLRDFVIDGAQIDFFNSHSVFWPNSIESSIDIASASLTQ
jgi:hypothetical protein